jgi:flagellar basal body-associated protein FliL
MAFYNQQPRDPSAIDPRRSSSDDVLIPLLVTIAIMALVVAGIYFFASEPTRVADTSVGPAVPAVTEPSALPTPETQREPRPTQAPIP